MGIPDTKRRIEDECSIFYHFLLEDENNKDEDDSDDEQHRFITTNLMIIWLHYHYDDNWRIGLSRNLWPQRKRQPIPGLSKFESAIWDCLGRRLSYIASDSKSSLLDHWFDWKEPENTKPSDSVAHQATQSHSNSKGVTISIHMNKWIWECPDHLLELLSSRRMYKCVYV